MNIQKIQPAVAWHNVVLAAESAQDPFEDVHVVTLISEYVAEVKQKLQASLGQLAYTTKQLSEAIDKQHITVQQYVMVYHTKIDVCIHAINLTDDSSIPVLTMVAEALDQLDGKDGTIFFGDKMSFNCSEIPWLTIH